MAITAWNPATSTTRGNISVGIAPTVVDIDAPTLSELDAATSLECSITGFNATSTTNTETIDWLCTNDSEQIPSSTTYTVDTLLIKATGQEDEDLLNALKLGDTVYVYRRDGKSSDEPIESGDRVWIWQVTITSIDPADAGNTFIAINAHVNVMKRTATSVEVTAP